MLKPLKDGWELSDFYRKEVIWVHNLEELYALYLVNAQEHVEYTLRKVPGMKRFQKDVYLDWLVKAGICPQSIITRNSKYWLETVSYCDGEMGLSLPGRMDELPNLFFEALRIVRNEKANVREQEDKSNGR